MDDAVVLDVAEVLRKQAAGASQSEIAMQLGASRWDVRKALSQASATIATPPGE